MRKVPFHSVMVNWYPECLASSLQLHARVLKAGENAARQQMSLIFLCKAEGWEQYYLGQFGTRTVEGDRKIICSVMQVRVEHFYNGFTGQQWWVLHTDFLQGTVWELLVGAMTTVTWDCVLNVEASGNFELHKDYLLDSQLWVRKDWNPYNP